MVTLVPASVAAAVVHDAMDDRMSDITADCKEAGNGAEAVTVKMAQLMIITARAAARRRDPMVGSTCSTWGSLSLL